MGAARGAVGGGPFLEEGVGGLGFELFASCVEADDVVNQGFLVEENVQADRADEGPEEVKSVLSVPIHDGLGRDVGTDQISGAMMASKSLQRDVHVVHLLRMADTWHFQVLDEDSALL